jgi:hypothetical protein
MIDFLPISLLFSTWTIIIGSSLLSTLTVLAYIIIIIIIICRSRVFTFLLIVISISSISTDKKNVLMNRMSMG